MKQGRDTFKRAAAKEVKKQLDSDDQKKSPPSSPGSSDQSLTPKNVSERDSLLPASSFKESNERARRTNCTKILIVILLIVVVILAIGLAITLPLLIIRE